GRDEQQPQDAQSCRMRERLGQFSDFDVGILHEPSIRSLIVDRRLTARAQSLLGFHVHEVIMMARSLSRFENHIHLLRPRLVGDSDKIVQRQRRWHAPDDEVFEHLRRQIKGSGAAGVATLGAAGVEVAQNVLAETQSAILPLVPYLDTLRWVLIAVALAGIAVAIYARIDDWKRGRR